MQSFVPRILIFSLLTLFFFNSYCQEQKAPKIGVVLSGGGAKGFSHIGFLRAIEEAGIKPDYITGTSMGAIIGALYSIGYTPDQIEKLAREIDWSTILGNNIRLDQVAFEEKPFFGRYLTELTVKNKKVYLPTALIEGQNLQLLLSKLTQPVHHISCFDSLPIPFACVAADIESGEPILLDGGNLAKALRASMAIPTVFTPVEIEGRFLVDGGLIRNFPVEEVKNMGADIIFGSYVGGKFKSRNDLNNFTDILKQSAFITSIFDSRNQAKYCDVYIEPNLDGYSVADFDQSDSIASRGYLSTQPYIHLMKQYADSAYQNRSPRVVPEPIIQDTFLFNEVLVHGNKHISDRLIKGRLQLKPEKTYTVSKIEERINKAYGTQYFDRITYAITPHDSASKTLNIYVKEKPKTKLKLALHYDTETNAGLLLNFTSRNFLFTNSKFIFEFDFATQPRLNLQYLKYIGKRQLWVATAGGTWVRQTDIPILNTEEEEALFNGNHVRLYLGAQTAFSSNFTLGAQLERNLYRFSPRVNADSLINDFTEFSYAMRYYWRFNSTDHLYFPTKGLALSASFIQRINNEQDIDFFTDRIAGSVEDEFTEQVAAYNSLTIEMTQHFTFFKRLTLSYFGFLHENFSESTFLDGTVLFGGVNPIFTNSVRFYGDQPNSFLAEELLIVGGSARMKLTHQLYATAILNYADTRIPAELKNEDVEPIQLGKKTFENVLGGGLELSYDSFIGPVRFAAMQHNHTGKIRFYFGLGYKF